MNWFIFSINCFFFGIWGFTVTYLYQENKKLKRKNEDARLYLKKMKAQKGNPVINGQHFVKVREPVQKTKPKKGDQK